MDDLISRQAAIETALTFFVEYLGGAFHEDMQKILKKRFEEVPPAQSELCEYCNGDVDGYVKPIEKNNHAFVRFGTNGWELSLKANGWHGSAKIRYCPMCGRDLYVK